MTTKQIAVALNGCEYPLKIPAWLKAEAKASGIVIVYGSSDDLMEFDGAIYDELGAYGGTAAKVTAAGLLTPYDSVDHDDEDAMREWFRKDQLPSSEIEALWREEGEYSWTFKTAIPHETFEITEDGEPYCRGIVFRLQDVAAVPTGAEEENSAIRVAGSDREGN